MPEPEAAPAPAATPPAPAEYEFTAEQNKTVEGVASGLWLLGVVLAVYGGKHVVRAVAEAAAAGWAPGRAVDWRDVGGHAASALLLIPLAVWFIRAAWSFGQVVETQGRDVSHLMAALDRVQTSYGWVILFGLASLLLGLATAVAKWAGV